MPVYDVDLVDNETCQQFSYRLAARTPKMAEASARQAAQPERFDVDGHPLDSDSPLRCMPIKKVPESEGVEWLRSCPSSVDKEEGQWMEAAEKALPRKQTKPKKRIKRNPEAECQARLLNAALVKSDRGGIQDDTDWVYQNLDVPWNKIPVDSVPSPGSVALLGEAKADKRWFLEKYHARLLPTKAKIDADGWLEADDGQIAEMAALIREEMAGEDVEV